MNERIRVLENRLRDATDPHEKIDLLNTLADELHTTNLSRAITLSEEARRMSEELVDDPLAWRRGVIASLLNLGKFNTHLSNYSQSLALLLQALNHAEALREPLIRANVLLAIAENYIAIEQPEEARELINEAMNIYEIAGNEEGQVRVFNSLGRLYLRQEDSAKALSYLMSGFRIVERTRHHLLEAEVLDMIGRAHIALQDTDNALRYGLKSLEIYRKLRDEEGEAHALTHVGEAYSIAGEHDQALNCLNQALKIAQRLKLTEETPRILIGIGSVRRRQGKNDPSLKAINEALTTALDHDDLLLQIDCYLALAETYKAANDWKRAVSSYEMLDILRKQMMRNYITQQVRCAEVLYLEEITAKEKEISGFMQKLEHETQARKRALEQLSEVGTNDTLTGLLNRRQFFTLAEREFKKSLRYEHPLSAIHIDIDRFDEVIKRYGNETSDQVLINIANRLRQSVREVDLIGRYGADMFMLVLPESSAAQAQQVAVRLQKILSETPTASDRGVIYVTACFGVGGMIRQYIDQVEKLFTLAEYALSLAKQEGGNRLRVIGDGKK